VFLLALPLVSTVFFTTVVFVEVPLFVGTPTLGLTSPDLLAKFLEAIFTLPSFMGTPTARTLGLMGLSGHGERTAPF
jgi:hypothetical protein